MNSDEVLADLAAKVGELEELEAKVSAVRQERDDLIMMAIALKVRRKKIAEIAHVAEISIYKIAERYR